MIIPSDIPYKLEIKPEYLYITIPAEYICVYHKILAMLADFGEEMLRDCKASCNDRNSGVVECYNMFNAAVAARKLGKNKLAETLIKYIKAKINQIYKNYAPDTEFIFPLDPNGEIKAFVSCDKEPKFYIDADKGDLYEHIFGNGFEQHIHLGPEDNSPYEIEVQPESTEIVDVEPQTPADDEEIPQEGLYVDVTLYLEKNLINPFWYDLCHELKIYFNGSRLTLAQCSIDQYFDNVQIENTTCPILKPEDAGIHNVKFVVLYRHEEVEEDVSIMKTDTIVKSINYNFVYPYEA